MLIADSLKKRLTICAYDRNIRKISSDFNFDLCSFENEKRD
ncbi:toxin-antitoxin system, toxin component [Leptospira santarosai]|nr:toxin-antitoxin system, toxin component [Leptospira santarosai]